MRIAEPGPVVVGDVAAGQAPVVECDAVDMHMAAVAGIAVGVGVVADAR